MRKWLYICMVGLLVLPGCGKNSKNVEEDFAQVTESAVATSTDVASDEDEIPEHLTYTIESDFSTDRFDVDAEVVSDGFNHVNVYKAEIADIDEEYVKNLAKRVFDNGDYEVLLPYFAMTETRLEEMINEIGNGTDDYFWTYPCAQMEKLLENPDMIYSAEYNEATMFYEGYMGGVYSMFGLGVENSLVMNLASFDDEEKTHYRGARLSGTIGGTPCELIVKALDNGNGLIWIYSRDENMRFAKAFFDAYNTEFGEGQQNPCDYNEALKIADTMIGKFVPDGDYRMTASYHRMVDKNITEQEPQGYRFYYTPCINEKLISLNGYTEAMSEDHFVGTQPVVCIDVDENGFLSAKFSQIVVPTEVMTKDARLMSFQQADQAIRNELEANYAQQTMAFNMIYEIDKIELSYLLVSTEEGNVFLPYWLYYDRNRGNELKPKRALWGVNALDGSVCRFGVSSMEYVLIDGLY